ncbi:TrkH family potassium uptake protein [Fusobacterium varium]|jgi:trk system potassium uptake protein TrkH|uniref:TrkH family potassium uptake protein n=1 Tax=Fusobacterium varium TaxID=856 RepID=UPI000E3FBCCA|nr:TrkH family potassium uptake protein [Fusobacterium varium]MCF0170043.1 TrkH family potassium uptake protein [Fusobacterium varium]MCI6032963.1 TrkH family potassium uptake protein [Fusobacterium varium]RGJ30887.1 TrkH family potassium uptake protein [Fusobacterium varium]RHG37954.1 TrkH family potassium uptake protein [Fusobacterium varium]
MNNKMVRYVIGHILKLETAFMLIPLALSFFYHESFIVKKSYIFTIVLLLISSLLISKKVPENQKIYAKEGLVIVSISWIALSLFGALPFVFSNRIPSFIDAFFETVSGFTTTGASILSNVEALEHSLLFWRSFTHLVGGMGVLVLALAILPKNTNQSLHIMKAEVPGPTFGKLVAKMSYNSRILYMIYIFITIIIIILLKLGGMPLFDSVVHAFGTVGTGGFGIKNSSVAYYNSSYIDYVLGIGMLLCGMNFNLFYALLLKNYKQVFKNEELKYYCSIVVLAIIAIVINIAPAYKNSNRLFRDVFFTVSSVITTTGYSTVDFDAWPVFSKTVLLFLMFVGGCAGSTAGGLKVSRIAILFKTVVGEFKKIGTPNRVINIKMDKKVITKELSSGISTYLMLYITIFLIAILCVSWDSPDFISAFSAVAATFNNIGPGMGIVGPTSNYASFSNINKLILSLVMLLGRLEIFPILILFSPSLYKKSN